MSANEVLDDIKARELYAFRTKDPAQLVQREIRRHCEGLTFKTAAAVKKFRATGDGRYEVLP